MTKPLKIVSKNEPKTSTKVPSTRDHLINVGLERMRKFGYGATGIQEILDTAEVPKGSFYHHFNSKEEFAVAVLERYVALEGEHCEQVFANTRQAPLKRLRLYFEDLIRTAGQSAPIHGCLAVAGTSTLLQERLSSSFKLWQSVIATVLQEAIDRGDLPKSTKAEPLAGFILNSWEGALLRSQADKNDTALKHFMHYMFENLLTSK
jgi:TetR/AcrR family transcriptional regulator, transcriptional repressor for nem operon